MSDTVYPCNLLITNIIYGEIQKVVKLLRTINRGNHVRFADISENLYSNFYGNSES